MAADAPKTGAPGEIEVVPAVAREFRLRRALWHAKTLVPIEKVIQRRMPLKSATSKKMKLRGRLSQDVRNVTRLQRVENRWTEFSLGTGAFLKAMTISAVVGFSRMRSIVVGRRSVFRIFVDLRILMRKGLCTGTYTSTWLFGRRLFSRKFSRLYEFKYLFVYRTFLNCLV